MSAINLRLRQYVTRVAFNITLSSRMVECLAEIQMMNALGLIDTHSNAVTKDLSSNWVGAARNLGARGLIKHVDPTEMKPRWSENCYQLTKAGELMCDILVEAGLIEPVEKRIKSLGDTLKAYRRKAA